MSTTSPVKQDPRVAALGSPNAPEVFQSVAHSQEIWKEDPFDVEAIHEEARETFQRLLNRATANPGPDSGRIFLLLGEAGAGKTHLMRAFRNTIHGSQRGYFGYMQMTTQTDHYGRYMLRNLIASLDQSYHEVHTPQSGLARLSNAVVDFAVHQMATDGPRQMQMREALRALREDDLSQDALNETVYSLASQILSHTRLTGIDFNLLVALIYLQTGHPELKNHVLSFLRGEALSGWQQKRLGGIVPKVNSEDPIYLLQQFGQLIQLVHEEALVICLDQLEDVYNLENSEQLFRRAMAAVRDISDQVPSSIIVISCLEDYYTKLKKELAGSLLDRIEEAPKPYRLENSRDEYEIAQIVERRLLHLYETMEVAHDPDDALYPFPSDGLHKLSGFRTRDVINACRKFQDHLRRFTTLPANWPEKEGAPPSVPNGTAELQQAWNDFLATFESSPPTNSDELTKILAQALETCSGDVNTARFISVRRDGTHIDVDGWLEPLRVGLCNKQAKGGGLKHQIEALQKAAGDRIMVLTRTTEFPSNPKTKIAQQIGTLITQGGRRVVIEDSDWRAMMAFEVFKQKHRADAGFAKWRVQDRPLGRLSSLQAILDLDNAALTKEEDIDTSESESSKVGTPDTVPEVSPTTTPFKLSANEILLGETMGTVSRPVTLDPKELTRHAAFLGGTGSGKTTVAVNILEQLMVNGISVIMIDRKGDLCRYADPKAWSEDGLDADAKSRIHSLRDHVHVSLYTPGHTGGNPLAISLVPPDASNLSQMERERVARCSANALARIMDYTSQTPAQKAQYAILLKAIQVLLEMVEPSQITVDQLICFIDERAPSLVNAIGKLEDKHFSKLVENLQATRLTKGSLLDGSGKPLDIGALLGGRAEGADKKPQLSIISTKFLGDNQDIEFWVAQFLVAVERFVNQNPSNMLQAVLLFDEADVYLPAARKPATKEPMESLLKRARSGGVGLFLASQSPGDFDYKSRDNIRSWFLGRIKEETALKKMKPMLSECKSDVSDQLPAQEPGEFHITRDGQVEAFKANRSLIQPTQLPEDRILELARG